MPITINGSGTVTGISAGGLPDAIITQPELAANVAGNGPVFSAYQSSGQTLNAATSTKITFTTEVFDTNSAYDTTNSRFQPTVAGYYLFTCGVRSDANPQAALHMRLVKNGNFEFAAGSFTNNGLGAFMSSCSGIAYLDGLADYVECYSYSGTTATMSTGSSATYFQGAMIRSAT
jgi:hypothetical protein